MKTNAESTFCTTCGALRIRGHVCPPTWLVWDPELTDGTEAVTVHAYDAQEAAEQWPEHSIDAQGRLGSGTTINVHVLPTAGGEVVQYTVQAVTTPAYLAKPTRNTESEVPRG